MKPDLFRIQHQIKQNSQGIQDYFEELQSWQKDIQTKEQKIVGAGSGSQSKTQSASGKQTTSSDSKSGGAKLPPIRNRVDISQQVKETNTAAGKKIQGNASDIFSATDAGGDKSTEEAKKLKRDVTPMPEYYKNWDRFNINRSQRCLQDDALNSDEEDEEAVKLDKQKQLEDYIKERNRPKTQDEMLKMTSGARPNTKIVVRGGTVKPIQEAEILKQQGNSYFVSLNFKEAVDCYTRCLEKVSENNNEMKKIVLSNRAQSYLKLNRYREAEQDADAALTLDSTHLKSLQRRGTARYYLGRLREAQRDLMRSLDIEANSTVAGYLKKVNDKMERIRFEAYEKLKRRCVVTDLDQEAREGKLLKVIVTEINKDPLIMCHDLQ